MPEGQIDSLSLFFYFEDSAGLLHASRLFELLASSYEQRPYHRAGTGTGRQRK